MVNLGKDWEQDKENNMELGRCVWGILKYLEYQAEKKKLFSNDSDTGFRATSAFERTILLHFPSTYPTWQDSKSSMSQDGMSPAF